MSGRPQNTGERNYDGQRNHEGHRNREGQRDREGQRSHRGQGDHEGQENSSGRRSHDNKNNQKLTRPALDETGAVATILPDWALGFVNGLGRLRSDGKDLNEELRSLHQMSPSELQAVQRKLDDLWEGIENIRQALWKCRQRDSTVFNALWREADIVFNAVKEVQWMMDSAHLVSHRQR